MTLEAAIGRGTRRLSRSRIVRLAPVLAILALLLIWPLCALVSGSFRTAPPGFPGQWTLAAWGRALSERGVIQSIGNSIAISLTTTLLATAAAAGLAFLSERTDTPFRRWIAPALFILLAMPGLLYAMGYALVGNAYTGLLNLPFQAWSGLRRGPIDVETWPGLLAVMALKKVSIIYLFLIGPFRALDPLHDEASLIAGASPWKTFLRIDLPILAPALTGAVLLGVVSGLQAFDMVLVLGWPFNLQVLTTRIYDLVNLSATPDYGAASVLSLGLLVVVAGLCLLQWAILGRRSFVTVGGKARAARRLRLGAARAPVGAAVLVFLIVAVGVPAASIAFTSVQRFPGVYTGLTLANYAEILVIPRLIDSLCATLVVAVSVGLAAMVLAVGVVQSGRAAGPRVAAILRLVTAIPLAMPGVVTALAVAWAFLVLPGFRQLYGTVWLVGLALVVCVIPFATQAANGAMAQIAPDLMEAARVGGASPRQAMGDILLRLIAPSFLTGWFMAAILVAGNLEVPLLLEAPGQEPVSAVIYDLFSRGEFSDASALLVVLLLCEGAVGLLGFGLLRGAGRLMSRWPARAMAVPRLETAMILEAAE